MDTLDSSGQVEGTMPGSSSMAAALQHGTLRSGSVSSYSSAVLPSPGTSLTSISQHIRKIKNAAAAPRILGQHTTCRTTSYGSLLSTELAESLDQRYRMAHFRELYDKKVNISTSFDPNTLLYGNCSGGQHHILKNNGRSKPVAFILSDQCFPAALPASREGDCLAVIGVEDAILGDLVSTFMHMSRGCNIAIGSVVIFSSLNHLGRVGTAAYAEDLVDALHTFRQTFSSQIRAVHGFPISMTKISDQFTIRALVEIEAWVDTVDLRWAHSLPTTSQYFKDNILASPVDQAN